MPGAVSGRRACLDAGPLYKLGDRAALVFTHRILQAHRLEPTVDSVEAIVRVATGFQPEQRVRESIVRDPPQERVGIDARALGGTVRQAGQLAAHGRAGIRLTGLDDGERESLAEQPAVQVVRVIVHVTQESPGDLPVER